MANQTGSAGIKAVVFDLYDTLVYFPDGIQVHKKMFARLGLDEEQSKAARKLAMTECFYTLADLAERIRPGSNLDWNDLEEELAIRMASVQRFPETLSVIKSLKKQGFKLGLITNLTCPASSPIFYLSLNGYFDHINLSFQSGMIKPDPRIYQDMIDRMHLRPEQILMIGDNFKKDVEAPRQAGMKAVHLDRSGASPDSISTLEGIFQHL